MGCPQHLHICVCHTVSHIEGLAQYNALFRKDMFLSASLYKDTTTPITHVDPHILVYDTSLYSDDNSASIHYLSGQEGKAQAASLVPDYCSHPSLRYMTFVLITSVLVSS